MEETMTITLWLACGGRHWQCDVVLHSPEPFSDAALARVREVLDAAAIDVREAASAKSQMAEEQ